MEEEDLKLSTRNKIVKILTATLFFSTLLVGCKEQDTQVTDNSEVTSDEPVKEVEDVKLPEVESVSISDTYSEVGYILDALSEAKRDNVIYSPTSLHMALGVLNEGTAGDTKAQLDTFLGDGYKDKASNFMSSYNVKDDYGEVNVANAIWVDKELSIDKEYEKAVKQYYQADANRCDFDNAQKTAKAINDWCSKKTNKLIDKIVDESSISKSDAAAVITNTVYFKQKWMDELYEIEDKRDFTNADGSKTAINYLSGDGVAYYENDDATAFSYDYMNGFHFVGILPKVAGEFNTSDIDIKALLDTESYDYDVEFIMPPLDYDTDNDLLKDSLYAMGLTDMFDPSKADLSKLSDAPLYIGDVVQKCNIKLDRYGTEAAAATALEVMMATAAPFEREKKEVNLDRPYMFLIMDPANEEVLFAGKVDTMLK